MSDLPLPLTTALADRYRVERELGRGGMATVFLATDIRHHRMVAIKIVDPQIAGLISADRFLQEIRVMASLQHPHILPLFDSGEVNGDLYYVMPYVEGETLRERITRERRLGVEDALQISREVASALDFAHRQGVVHRDIKPENILLSDGHALIADFGIARALMSDRSAVQRLTATGVAIGTPGYMSPEQALGEGAIDARTDVYALGAVTHEMLAGQLPFTGPSAQAVLARVLTESPPPLSQLRRGISPAFSAAVQKSLAIEPADRFASVKDFAHALETTEERRVTAVAPRKARRRAGLAVLVAAVAVVSVGAWFALKDRGRTSTSTEAVRVAVLPFRETGTPARPGFAAGVVSALRSDLATLPNVEVIAGASVAALGDSVRSPLYVAQQLGATHVLTGSMQWDHSSTGESVVHIVPELIRVTNGVERATAGEPIVDRVDDLFKAQGRVSMQIARSLGVVVSAEAALRLSKPPTRNLEAYEAWLRSTIDAEHSRELLQRAVALDTGFVQAWAALGLDAGLSYQGTLSPEIGELARQASAKAMVLDSNAASSRLARAMYERHVTRNFEEAVRQGLKAMELAPGNVNLMHFTAAALWNARRIDEALALAQRAAALDPRNASALARVATIQIWMRDFTAAEVSTGRALVAANHSSDFVNVDSVVIPLARGNLISTRQYVASLGPMGAKTVAMAMREWNLAWAFDSVQVAEGLQRLRAANQLYAVHTTLAQLAALRKDERQQAAHADSAANDAMERLRGNPMEPRLRVALAFASALAGRPGEALAQADTASASRSAWKDGFQGAPLSLNVAEIRAIAGDTEHAIALLDSLLKVPGYVTPAYLRIDPWFDRLRADPRFRALVKQ